MARKFNLDNHSLHLERKKIVSSIGMLEYSVKRKP